MGLMMILMLVLSGTFLMRCARLTEYPTANAFLPGVGGGGSVWNSGALRWSQRRCGSGRTVRCRT
jgi:hypothetical protein